MLVILSADSELLLGATGAGFRGGKGASRARVGCWTAAWTAGLSEGGTTVEGEGTLDGVGGDGDGDSRPGTSFAIEAIPSAGKTRPGG